MTDAEFAGYVLGKRFGCDFFVTAIGPGPIAVLAMHGTHYTIMLTELRALLDREFVRERPGPAEGRES